MAAPPSPFIGIAWHHGRRQWLARYRIRQRWYEVGYYDSDIEAAKAHDRALEHELGADAVTNRVLGLYERRSA